MPGRLYARDGLVLFVALRVVQEGGWAGSALGPIDASFRGVAIAFSCCGLGGARNGTALSCPALRPPNRCRSRLRLSPCRPPRPCLGWPDYGPGWVARLRAELRPTTAAVGRPSTARLSRSSRRTAVRAPGYAYAAAPAPLSTSAPTRGSWPPHPGGRRSAWAAITAAARRIGR